MSESSITIRQASPGDAERWRELFTAYGVFYETDFDGAVLGGRMRDFVDERYEGLTTPEDRDAFARDFGDKLLDELAREVDRMEAELVERFPRLKYVDLEAD